MAISLFYGLVAGLGGTLLGGLLACAVKPDNSRLTAWLLSFSSGIMLAVVCFDLIPMSIHYMGVWFTLAFALLGALLMMCGQWVVERKLKNNSKRSIMQHTGIIIMVAIALHNLPEGLIIGAGQVVSKGLVMTLVIGLHDLPEGLAMALPLRCAGNKWYKIILGCFLAGVPTVIGAGIGFALGSISHTIIALCTAFAAGSMLYVVYAELIPEANRMGTGAGVSVFGFIGVIAGLLLVFCI